MAQRNRAAIDAMNPSSDDSGKEDLDLKEETSQKGEESDGTAEEKQTATDSQEDKNEDKQKDQSETKQEASESEDGQDKHGQTETAVEKEDNESVGSPWRYWYQLFVTERAMFSSWFCSCIFVLPLI